MIDLLTQYIDSIPDTHIEYNRAIMRAALAAGKMETYEAAKRIDEKINDHRRPSNPSKKQPRMDIFGSVQANGDTD